MSQKVLVHLDKEMKDPKSGNLIGMYSFEMSLGKIMDKCIGLLNPNDLPKEGAEDAQQKLAQTKLSLIDFQNILFDCRVEAIVPATLKEIFYLAISKMNDSDLGVGYKILNKLFGSEVEFDLRELRALLNAVLKIRSNNQPNDELHLFAKIFAIGELQEYIKIINPVEIFEFES